MDATTDKADVHMGSTRGQRIGQLLMIVVAAAVLAAALYYAMSIIRSTTFSTDRGFRVLDESIGQFENLQDSMASLLKLVPSIPECEGLPARRRSSCIKSSYQSRLDVPELKLEDRLDEKAYSACAQSRREEFLLRLDEPRVGFTIFPCSVSDEEPGSKYVLRGSFARSLERFNSQSFFDESIFTLANGAVLAELTRFSIDGNDATDTNLQEPHRATLMVTDASYLLQRAAAETAKAGQLQKAKSAGEADRNVPAHPVVFSETIAGQKYRVFVVAFRPAYPVYASANANEAAQRAENVYLIGLKREKLAAALAYALWPNGTFAITIAALLAMLLWPLATLRLSAPQDPISRGEALAVMTALLLIPALLTIAVVWAWSHRTLHAWADEGAASYAHEVEQHLVSDLQTSTGLLDEYRQRIYTNVTQCAAAGAECLSGALLPLRPNAGASVEDPWLRVAPSPDPNSPPDCCGIYYLWMPASRAQDRLASWSPLRTALALDETGEKIGPRLSAFGAVPQKRSLNLADRSYFEALKSGNAWHVSKAASWRRPPEFGFVAQRLFSRADAARTLQVAVPRCPPTDVFCGIVTGDSRVHALTAKIDPPLLRFAVIDRDSGTVLFHSDDSRSLAENFFTETEHDADLHAALRLNNAAHFRGRYLGDPHRFYLLPMSGVSWSIVVFYSTKTLGDLPLQAGVAALTAFAGIALLLLGVFGVLLFSQSSAARRALAFLWPQWRFRQIYMRLGWSLIAAALVTTLVAFAFLRTKHGVAALSVAIILPIATTWLWNRQMQQSVAKEAAAMSLRAYERAYIRCMVGVLFFISVLPAAWLALEFHDAQVHGLLREAMQRASTDVERRHGLIAHDLQRWVPNAKARMSRYPDPWTLTEFSVPGYAFNNGRWTATVFRTMPWARIDGPAPVGPWRQLAWRAAAQSSEQLRRIGLLDPTAAMRIDRCGETVNGECYRTTAADGHPVTITMPLVVEGNGRRAANERVTVPLLLAGAGVFVVSLWLAALVARRFFGVGLPFSGRYLPVLSIEDHSLGSVLMYRPRSDTLRPQRLAPEVLRATLEQVAHDRRIDLSTLPLTRTIATEPGNYLLLNLDIALLDRERRQFVLSQLESMLARVEVGLYITCEKPPAQWLYRADTYPEARAEQRLQLQEELQWDNVFARLTLINLRRGVQAMDRRTSVAPALHDARVTLEELYERHPHDLTDKDRDDYLAVHADMHYHRAWKLCSRDERLLLHQLATGRFANPANHHVTERLLRAGLVALAPWPRLTDAGFGRFVRTAETRRDFTEWQREASQSAWRSVKTPLLIVLVILVGWLIWTAGDYVQAFSAILVAAVALLGQFGQVVNLVRGSVSQKG
jgi:hypothetical protein